MGRNAYINFYLWYYNEHRGQAPVTTIAKRAGLTWRKMTPQEKGRFMDKNGYPKGKIPIYIVRPKFQRMRVTKIKNKSVRKSRKNLQQKVQSKYTSHKKVTGKKKAEGITSEVKEETNKIHLKQSKERNFKDESVQKNEEDGQAAEEESEEIIARRKIIQRWMDKNHYC